MFTVSGSKEVSQIYREEGGSKDRGVRCFFFDDYKYLCVWGIGEGRTTRVLSSRVGHDGKTS